MKEKGTVLVPWDFSQIAEYALAHSALYAEVLGTEITLVHVVKKEKEVVEATNKLNTVATVTTKKYNIKTNVIVREGSIFNTITNVAEEVNAQLCVMGTHGMKGLQKFTGSWALKVIVDTKVPFIVVQSSFCKKISRRT